MRITTGVNLGSLYDLNVHTATAFAVPLIFRAIERAPSPALTCSLIDRRNAATDNFSATAEPDATPMSSSHDHAGSKTKRTFSFPLPAIPTLHREIYALHRHTPALRGVQMLATHFTQLTEGWSMTGEQTLVLDDAATRATCKPSQEKQRQWKFDRERCCSVPWDRLHDETQDEDVAPSCPEEIGSLSLLRSDQFRATVSDYIEAPKTVKWLILPQPAHGWALEDMEQALHKLCHRPTINSHCALNDEVAPFSLRIDDATPALRLALFSSEAERRAFQRGRTDLRRPLNNGTFAWCICGLDFCVLVGWLSAMMVGSAHEWPTRFYLPWHLSFGLLLLLSFAFMCYRADVDSKHWVWDAIGVAWPLKRWIATGCPASYSRSEVLEQLRLSPPPGLLYAAETSSEGDELRSSSLYLQRRPDPQGWFVLAGVREGDFLARYSEVFRGALARGDDGTAGQRNLDAAMRSVDRKERMRKEAQRWESDDATGVELGRSDHFVTI